MSLSAALSLRVQMSDNDAVDSMEWVDAQGPPPPAVGRGAAGFFQNTEESDSVHRTLVKKQCAIKVSFEAPDGERTTTTTTLQTALQSWCNKQTPRLTLENALCLSDGSIVFEISPAPDMKMLQSLNGKKLTARNGKTVIINSIGEFQSSLPVPERDPMDDPAELQESEHMQPVEGTNMERSTEAPAESETCFLSVSHFWYLNHIYKEEIQGILDRNGVTMEPEVTVAFKSRQKDGNQAKALEEFTDLTRKTLSGSDITNIPLKHLDAQKLVDSLNIVKAPDEKLLLVLSSQEMSVHGPSPGCNAIRNSLAASQRTNYRFCKGATWAPSQNSPGLVLNIRDHLSEEGLTMERSDWDQMTNSLRNHISDIETKFGVRFSGWRSSGGKFTIKAQYGKSEKNPSMESHATRALVRLYQRFVTSQRLKDTRSSRLDQQSIAEPRVAPSTGPVSNGQWRPSKAEAALGRDEGASGGESEEEKCPICLDSFTDKTKLKCKHEFCTSCLNEAVKSQGRICPVCKDVFGVVEGDQPDGKMEFYKNRTQLPGFRGCGTIVISYEIPPGRQTEKHPNPGQPFNGTRRTAYLPDNKEGNEVLKLLIKAFERKLIFTVGRSITTGCENQVTWNDIHHKTCIHGGPLSFGYPDPTYLTRVKDELKSKGVV